MYDYKMHDTYAYHVRHRNGWGTGFGPRPKHCAQCGADLPEPPRGTCHTGYGCGKSEPVDSHPEAPALKKGETLERSPAHCFKCCAENDKREMLATGRATMYLVARQTDNNSPKRWYVTNWPSSLEFPVMNARKAPRAGGFGADRMDAWFVGPDSYVWHAINRGDNEIARCRRTRYKWVQLAHGGYGQRRERV